MKYYVDCTCSDHDIRDFPDLEEAFAYYNERSCDNKILYLNYDSFITLAKSKE